MCLDRGGGDRNCIKSLGSWDLSVFFFREWSPLEASDALELLSPTFRNIELRRYAVSRLSHAKPEQILLYLPQLVQALKYERLAVNMSKDAEACI